jgi:hypothetical protein
MLTTSSGGILIPQDISDLLTVSVDGDADDATIQGMITINAAANQWLSGVIDDIYYCDLLNQYGIDPYPYIEPVEEHLRLLML